MLMSCTAPQAVRLTEVVGPAAHQQAVAREDGALQVFTRCDFKGDPEGPVEMPHTDYDLCTPGGSRLQLVRNSTERDLRNPVIISLHPGRYIVRAAAKSSRLVEVPVVIKAAQMTVLRLDGSGKSRFASADDVVKLPDGTPIGWRSSNN